MSYSYRSSRTTFNNRASSNRRPSGGNRRKTGSNIDPRRFVAVASNNQVDKPYVPTHAFSDFPLNDLLHKNLAAKGYVTPSPIQDQAMTAGLEGRDVIGMAGTGTGKTAAFALPILQRLMDNPKSVALIIAPTRELAEQIEVECRSLGKGSGLTGALLIGGTSMGPQLRSLKSKPRIVVGTPGRIKDHMERGTLMLQHADVVVLDEVDRMLDMGFVNDIRSIINRTSKERQSMFFSATMNAPIRNLINDFSRDPVTIQIETQSASENVHQDVVHYRDNSDRINQLHDLLTTSEVSKVIIFDETQRGVERLSRELIDRGFKTESMHGGKTQGQRQRALAKFKNSEINVLVATDVAARGIDVADISHVVNFSIPKEYDDYIHRIGRAGRAGRIGHAYTFIPRSGASV